MAPTEDNHDDPTGHETGDHEGRHETDDHGDDHDRRTFLDRCRTVLAGGSLAALFAERATTSTHGAEHGPQDHGPTPEVQKDNLGRQVERQSSVIISGAFLAQVFANVSGRRAFCEASAKEMLTLGLSRTAILGYMAKKYDDPELDHMAAHERHEYLISCFLVPLLTALAEIASEYINVDANTIFRVDPRVDLDDTAGGSLSYRFVSRPSLDSVPEVWSSYADMTAADTSDKLGQVNGIALGGAPTMTTYFASGFTDKEKPEILRMLVERYTARGVARWFKNNPEATEIPPDAFKAIQSEACGRANFIVNDHPCSLNKLEIDGSANKYGAIGAFGDPPELFGMWDLKDDPKMYGRICYRGTKFVAGYSDLFNRYFMHGVANIHPSLSHEGTFFGSALSAAASVGEFALKKIRDMMTDPLNWHSDVKDHRRRQRGEAANGDEDTRRRDRAGKRVHDLMQGIGNGRAKDVRSILVAARSSRPAISLNLRTLMGGKLQILKSKVTGHSQRVAKLMNRFDTTNTETSPVDQLKSIVESMVKDGDADATAEKLKEFEQAMSEVAQHEDVMRFVETMEDMCHMGEDELKQLEVIAARADAEEPSVEATGDDVTDAEETNAPPATAVEAAQGIADASGGAESAEFAAAAEKAFETLDIDPAKFGDPEHLEEVAERIRTADPDTVAAALEVFTQPPPYNDGPAGVKIEKDERENTHAHAHFFGHSSREVAEALLTQIPSVPAIVSLAKRTLSKMVGMEENAVPSNEQLQKILNSTLWICVGTSAFADNVAAYMFARDVLFGFFEKRYLPQEMWGTPEGRMELYKKFPEVREYVMFAALKTAEFAGALTKVGNGPNFLQHRYEAIPDESANPQGITIKRDQISMGSSLVNPYAWLTVGTFVPMMMREGRQVIAKADTQAQLAA